MSIDFLVGISIFLITFGFIIQFIPGLFRLTSGDESLNSVAYRTAEILVADPGWWNNNTHNGTDWEMHPANNISRIGFAADITPNTKLTLTPNILNQKKILTAQGFTRSEFINRTSLYYKISQSQIEYGYNITFTQNNKIMVLNNTPLIFGEKLPPSQDVFKITRKVLIENGTIASFEAKDLTCENLANDKAYINISGPQNEDVLIQIKDFNASGSNPQFDWAKVNGVALNMPSDYTAYKKTNTSDLIIYSHPLNNTDTMRLIFNHTLFPINSIYQLELKFSQINFTLSGPPYTEYVSNVEPLYEPASLIVEVWK